MLSAELALYVFVYDNFHLVTLPWDSPWTWYICFIGVDFIYYWFHRAAHGKLMSKYKNPFTPELPISAPSCVDVKPHFLKPKVSTSSNDYPLV